MMRKGFSIIELLVAIGVIAIISSIGIMSLVSHRNRRNLDFTVTQLVSTARDVQQKALNQVEEDSWGLRFVNSDKDFYQVFKGLSFAIGTAIQRINLESGVQFSDPTEGSEKEVVFSQTTGLPGAAASITFSLVSDLSISRTITIDANGKVSEE